MRVKLYILTYNSEVHLNKGLDSLFDSGIDGDLEINIINNHTTFMLSEDNEKKLKQYKSTIFHNRLQPDFGTGHSSRNWNQAIIDGFKNLKTPDSDIVVCAQDDHHYDQNWLQVLKNRVQHENMQFMCAGIGDGICCYTPIGVLVTGLWDERFCSLHYGEHDYFIRTVSWLGKSAAISDQNGAHGGKYGYNSDKASNLGSTPHREHDKDHLRGLREYQSEYARHLFIEKWGMCPNSAEAHVHQWADATLVPKIPSYMFYPYFERDMDLKNKGYFTKGCE